MLKHKRINIILIAVAGMLLIPLIVMQFTDEVNWNLADFVVAAILLLSTTLGLNYTLSKIDNVKSRLAISFSIIILLILVWAELAVGLFGSPLAGS